VLGLLADLPRKNCWTSAQHAGDPNPDGMQHLLGRAVWDHDGVRDDVRAFLTSGCRSLRALGQVSTQVAEQRPICVT